jgi:hypothetical protein
MVLILQSCVQVQVIPWVLVDSNYVCGRYQKLDPSKTVFVGGLHGMLNAGWCLVYYFLVIYVVTS